jgi:hypothetical protein
LAAARPKESDQTDTTAIALLQQNFDYVRADIADLKQEIRQINNVYATKEQLLQLRTDFDSKAGEQARRVDLLYRGSGAVIAAVTLAIIGAILKLILKV